LELTAGGELVVMPPTGGEAGNFNFLLYKDLLLWNERSQLGVGFDASTIFALPNGAMRSPNFAWAQRQRWEALNQQQRRGFPPLAPDFVIKLVSPSDLQNQRFSDLQLKMQEYIDTGVRLGWLIVPESQQVEIYRRDRAVEQLISSNSLSGEDMLPGLVFNLPSICQLP
jgi:Uma2 family endonuclease